MFKVLSRKIIPILLGALALACCLPASAETPDANALLKRSDAFRNGWPSYVVRVKITDYDSGKPDEEHLYGVSQKGTDKTYVKFFSPREKGEHLLMLGDDMWVYLPDTSRPVRITPLERLSGDASNGDVARTNYAADYAPVYLRTENLGSVECHVLDLTAKRKGATYQRILYWLRAEDARPVRAEFYLTSGKHIKSATFDEYAQSGGKVLLRRLTLYDEIRHNSHSVLEYSGATPRIAARQALLSGPHRQVLTMNSRLLLPLLLLLAAWRCAAQDASHTGESRLVPRYSLSRDRRRDLLQQPARTFAHGAEPDVAGAIASAFATGIAGLFPPA